MKYLDRVETGIESIEAFLGKRVHEALELLYRDLWDERLHELDDLLDFYEERWEGGWHSGVLIARPVKRASEYFDDGVDCIRNYYRENYPFDQNRTIFLEELVEFELDRSGRRVFRGYIDRVASRPDGTCEIHDYKTGKRVPDQSELEDDRQLTLYQVAVQNMHPEARRVELVRHYLSRGVSFRLRRTESDLRRIVQETKRFIRDIETTTRFPAVKRLCDWCEFRAICPAWTRGVFQPVVEVHST